MPRHPPLLISFALLIISTLGVFASGHDDYGAYSKYGDLGSGYDGHQSGYDNAAWSNNEKAYAGYDKEHEDQGAKEAAAGHKESGYSQEAKANHGAQKHEDAHSGFGKDQKADTFGYFEHRYKQPEFHFEQFHSEEKHGRKFGDEEHAIAVADHGHDHSAASGHNAWGDHHDREAYGETGYGRGSRSHASRGDGEEQRWALAAQGRYERDHGDYGSHHETAVPQHQHHHHASYEPGHYNGYDGHHYGKHHGGYHGGLGWYSPGHDDGYRGGHHHGGYGHHEYGGHHGPYSA